MKKEFLLLMLMMSMALGMTAQPSGGHEYVDLGLPSGTLWAMCNVGATSPEEYGDYFAWGETSTKDYYDWSNYKWCYGSESTFTKYCTHRRYGYDGYEDLKKGLDLYDDAAYVNWGAQWCMPTKAQWDELCWKCSWIWTIQNEVYGFKVIGPNRKSIFLPATGHHGGKWFAGVGDHGCYWSCTLCYDNTGAAYGVDFSMMDDVRIRNTSRSIGYAVRPVRNSQK